MDELINAVRLRFKIPVESDIPWSEIINFNMEGGDISDPKFVTEELSRGGLEMIKRKRLVEVFVMTDQ